jgi:septal ring-binding cell division protein DamX
MPRALELGRKRIEAIPAHHWTIRLEIADLPSTLKNAVAAFPGTEPDLFIAPIKLRGGKTSYQLFLGDYPSKADAERAARSVPSFFLEGGQRPKPFSGTGLPQ